MREARGEKVVGFKIGYTSPSVRKAGFRTMGIDHSVHGYLWDTEQKPIVAKPPFRTAALV